uniref:Uncharacterized protein n=1 Tax=Hippocampus comes TaxID=109280 RepID=A0A3Q2XU36_HIPCM
WAAGEHYQGCVIYQKLNTKMDHLPVPPSRSRFDPLNARHWHRFACMCSAHVGLHAASAKMILLSEITSGLFCVLEMDSNDLRMLTSLAFSVHRVFPSTSLARETAASVALCVVSRLEEKSVERANVA